MADVVWLLMANGRPVDGKPRETWEGLAEHLNETDWKDKPGVTYGVAPYVPAHVDPATVELCARTLALANGEEPPLGTLGSTYARYLGQVIAVLGAAGLSVSGRPRRRPMGEAATEATTGTSVVHMCIDIRGMLAWPKRRLARAFRVDGGGWATAHEAREHLLDQIAMGRKVLPFGKACEGFSYDTGCPGHPSPAAEETPK